MKVYHRGSLINQRGGVSALCFLKPRAIDLRKATWTNRDEAVTCQKCLAVLHAKPPADNPATDVAEAVRQDETTDRRVRASSAGGEEK